MDVAVTTMPVVSGPEPRSGPPSDVRIQILGPLRLWRDGVEVDVGPRQQASLLALLVAHEGEPISKADLIDLIWEDHAPDSAVNVIHKYVGALRRLLEPTLPTRGTSSYLLRRGSGYLCATRVGTLDLASFRELVRTGRDARVQGHDQEALTHYEQALQLWRGSAGDGLTHGPEAMAVFAGLNGELFDACVAATELAMSMGRPENLLSPLRLADRDRTRSEGSSRRSSSNAVRPLPPWPSRPRRSRASASCH